MAADLRKVALELGYLDARAVTGHPFDVWINRLKSTPAGRYMSFEHDPARASGWPTQEITLWVALASTPPYENWPEGEIGGFYMSSASDEARRSRWEDAAEAAGCEVKRGVLLPERAAAIRAGLGDWGLFGPLLTPQWGSFVSIAIVLVHEAPPDGARGPEHDASPGCERCGKCVAACPVEAITLGEGVNTLGCLRNLMNFPAYMSEVHFEKMGKRIWGCDTCQLACPHNAGRTLHNPPDDMLECVRLEELLRAPDLDGLARYIQSGYIDPELLKGQAALAAANTGRSELLPLVENLIGGANAQLSRIAAWAAARLRSG